MIEVYGYSSDGFVDAKYSNIGSGYFHYPIWYEDRIFNVAYAVEYSRYIIECVDSDGVSRYVHDFPRDRMVNWGLMDQPKADITAVYIYTSPDFLNITFIGYDNNNDLKFRKVYATKDLPGYPNPAEYKGDMTMVYVGFGALYGSYAELLLETSEDSSEFMCYMNLEDGTLHEAGSFELPEVTFYNNTHYLAPGADSKLWSYVDESGVFGIRFGWTKDETEWCYLDCDYSVLASFASFHTSFASFHTSFASFQTSFVSQRNAFSPVIFSPIRLAWRSTKHAVYGRCCSALFLL